MSTDVTLLALSVVGWAEPGIALSSMPDLGPRPGHRDLILRGRSA